MATYRPDGTRIRKRDKKRNRGNVGVGNVGVGNVGAGSSTPPPPPPVPEPPPSAGPIVSDDRDTDAEGNVGIGVSH
jgi:hypothetical protein